ncbi:toll/interleukin-1 receptor domain-containing protein [Glycocaulis alkaliphilus]|uniref:toll/interleukin-1 receptor domain-containing protein n=1 Tax=Glycocaulis alkaliphilus TaxID=1434191 RepID=UPI000FD8D5AC|nr:toll/interleukin-1 receptor domain-containing protein [Glycocaulis alkaliphilus]GGB81093.1 hypothetical protein GCM10007417_21260 [Glycocaulis alkaliphilus]
MKLTKSNRIKMIKNIASRMEDEDWTSIDLTLGQFSLPTIDQWSGNTNSYIVTMIQDAADETLCELAEHFGMEVPQKNDVEKQVEEPTCWEEGKLRLFISHLTEHRGMAAQLQEDLKRLGISAFVAHNDITPTHEWEMEIQAALSSCHLLLAIIHPGFKESAWCDQEIGYALGRGVPVFTVRCGADPHGFVSRFQGFNGNGKKSAQIAVEIFEATIEHKKLQSIMAKILVDLFVKSGSFHTAKIRIEYLEKLKVWEDSFNSRIEQALEENDQISYSWGVPDRVRALLKKWS